MKHALFVDFDGTISSRDIGYAVFNHFSGGKNDELLPDWKSGKITTRECLLAEAAMVKASKDEIIDFIDKIDIDNTFPDFVKLCKDNDIPLTILSDGMDFYIKHHLNKSNLNHIKYHTNHAILEDNTIKIEFTRVNKKCPSCGICKGELIREFKQEMDEEYKIIFIGDGYSDACGAKEADYLFAKKDLVEFCNEHSLNYYSYSNFDDVTKKLRELEIIR
jgi:2,3-diketo-5-methylthio-1-phosphopentane phosphatase